MTVSSSSSSSLPVFFFAAAAAGDMVLPAMDLPNTCCHSKVCFVVVGLPVLVL
jgi:hypothetical protein